MYSKYSSTNLDTLSYQSSSNPGVALYWFIYYIVDILEQIDAFFLTRNINFLHARYLYAFVIV